MLRTEEIPRQDRTKERNTEGNKLKNKSNPTKYPDWKTGLRKNRNRNEESTKGEGCARVKSRVGADPSWSAKNGWHACENDGEN